MVTYGWRCDMAVKPIVFYTRPDAAKPVIFYAPYDKFYTNTGGDGNITKSDYASWASVRGASTGTLHNTEVYSQALATLMGGAPPFFYVSRIFIPFDTSDIPDDMNISAVNLGLYLYEAPDSGTEIGLTLSTQANPESLISEDYDNITLDNPLEGAIRMTPSGAQGTLTIFSLNSTGISWINKTGHTKFCIRTTWDIDDNEPSLWEGQMVRYYTEEQYQANGNYRPYLEVFFDPVVFYTRETP